jgi:hypothetical protein
VRRGTGAELEKKMALHRQIWRVSCLTPPLRSGAKQLGPPSCPERMWYNSSQLGASATRAPNWHLHVAERLATARCSG